MAWEPRRSTMRCSTMWAVVAVAVAVAARASTVAATPAPDASRVHVHLIPHSHCDPGWLETFSGYYSRKVGKILTHVVSELKRDASRRFVWAEISFFMMWYSQQPADTRADVEELVANGQLEFVGSGWVQNDEANPHPEAVIDQVTEGHEYLLSLFGVRPRIAWQIDPFGHSSVTPALFAAMGYDALVINRIHFRVKQQFKSKRAMEFVWRTDGIGSEATGGWSPEMFTHVLHTHYSAPAGFDFEERAVTMTSNNMRNYAQKFTQQMTSRARAYRTKNLLVPFGDDFKFYNAAVQFNSMDKLVKYINSHPDLGVSIKYSTLSEYFDHVRTSALENDVRFPVYTHDFYPYADNSKSYWTGYFATRPVLKAACRSTFALLRSSEVLFALARPYAGLLAPASKSEDTYQWRTSFRRLEAARLDLALALHHDAITGTAKKEVVRDYTSRLNRASNDVQEVLSDTVGLLLAKKPSEVPMLTHVQVGLSIPPNGKSVDTPVVITNPLAWRRTEVVHLTLNMAHSPDAAWPFVRVVGSDGSVLPAQIHPLLTTVGGVVLDHYVSVLVDLAPLGVTTIFVTVWPSSATSDPVFGAMPRDELAPPVPAALFGDGIGTPAVKGAPLRGGGGGATQSSPQVLKWPVDRPNVFALGNKCVSVDVDLKTGLMVRATAAGLDAGVTLDQTFRSYTTSQSGAYLFKPSEKLPRAVPNSRVTIAVIDGPVVKEVQVRGDTWSQTLRVLVPPEGDAVDCTASGSPFTTVAVVPTLQAPSNREIVVELTTNMPVGKLVDGRTLPNEPGGTAGHFVTSNGLQLLDRPRARSSDPVAPSYYPMNTAAGMTREEATGQDAALFMFNRQPLAVTSRAHDEGTATPPGSSLEVMIHRNLKQDDGRGLAQPINDASEATVPLWLTLQPLSTLETSWRRTSLHVHYPPQLLFPVSTPDTAALMSTDAWTAAFHLDFQPLDAPLQDHLHLMTLKVRDGVTDDVVLRVQSLSDIATTHLPMDFVGSPHGGNQLPLSLTFVRPRTLSLNRDEGYLLDSRLLFPSDESDKAAEDSHTVDKAPGVAGDTDGLDRQNTEEEGVFLSKDALDKAAEDEAKRRRGLGGRRRLLQADDPLDSATVTVQAWPVTPLAIRSALVVLRPDAPIPEVAQPPPPPPPAAVDPQHDPQPAADPQPDPQPNTPPPPVKPSPPGAAAASDPSPAPARTLADGGDTAAAAAAAAAAATSGTASGVEPPATPQYGGGVGTLERRKEAESVWGDGGVVSASAAKLSGSPHGRDVDTRPSALKRPNLQGVMGASDTVVRPGGGPLPSAPPVVHAAPSSDGLGFTSGLMAGVCLAVVAFLAVRYRPLLAALLQRRAPAMRRASKVV